MAKNKISGLTIKIGGDTTELSKALKEPNQQARDLQSKLKAVEQALKLDPNNTELIEQKMRLLGQAIDSNENKLKLLKTAQEQFKASGKDIDSDEYIELQRQITSTTKTLNQLKKKQDEVNSSSKKISNAFKNMSNSLDSASKKTKGLSTAAAGMLGALTATVPATDELRSDLSKLDNNARLAGAGIDSTRKAFELFNVVSDETDSSVEATSNLLQAGFTKSNLQKAVEGLAGAYLRFPDTLKIESLADSLQETLATGKATGQFGELLDRLGIGADKFSEKLAKCKTEAEKQNYALKVLSENGLMNAYESWKKNNDELVRGKEATFQFQQSMAKLAEVISPIITRITEMLTVLIEKFTSLPTSVQNLILGFIGFTAVLSPVLSVVSNLTSIFGGIGPTFSAIGGAVTKVGGIFSSVFGAIKTIVTTLWGVISAHPVIAVITAIIGVVVLLYNKCEWFRKMVNNIVSNIFSFFKNIVDSIGAFFTVTIPQKIEQFISFFKSIPERIGKLIDDIIAWFSQLPYNLGVLVGTGIGHIIQFGLNLKKFATVTVPEFINSVVEWFSQLPSKIGTWLSDTLKNVQTWGSNMISKAKNTASNFINSVIQYISNLPSKFMEWLSSTTTKVANWGYELGRKGSESAKKLLNSIVDGVKSLPSKMLSIGKNIVRGIADGITGAGDWLMRQIKKFADGVVDGIKGFFGIHSPSRVMKKLVGKNLVAGIGEGIIDNESLALKPLKQLQKEMTSSFNPNVSASVTRALNYNGTITVESPINIDLDGKPIYKNVVRRTTQNQSSRTLFQGGV